MSYLLMSTIGQDYQTLGLYGFLPLMALLAISLLWFRIFPPTVVGLFPGLISVIPGIMMLALAPLLLEIVVALPFLHCFDIDLSETIHFIRGGIVGRLAITFLIIVNIYGTMISIIMLEHRFGRQRKS